MSNAAKGLFSLFLLMIVVTYVVFRADLVVFDAKKDVYVQSIKSASQVATKQLIDTKDINFIYDGNRREPSDIAINLGALDVFKETLTRVLESKNDGSMSGVTNINIPLTGFVTHRYIMGVTYDGAYLLPKSYTFESGDHGLTCTNSVIRDKMRFNNSVWELTLGDAIYIPDKDGTMCEYRILDDKTLMRFMAGEAVENRNTDNDVYMGGFLDKMGFSTIRDFKTYVVMENIDGYLNDYSGAAFNPISKNIGSTTEFELGKSKYSENRKTYNNTKSSVIDGPGLFAIVDVYKGSGSNQKLYQRIASFGGSELIAKEE